MAKPRIAQIAPDLFGVLITDSMTALSRVVGYARDLRSAERIAAHHSKISPRSCRAGYCACALCGLRITGSNTRYSNGAVCDVCEGYSR